MTERTTDGRERGTFTACRRGPFLFTKAGKIRHHGSQEGWPPSNCRGSGQPPAEEKETSHRPSA